MCIRDSLYCIIGDHVKLGEFGKENAKLFEKERLLEKILETGVDEELLEKLKAYWELQGEIRGEVEREGFILSLIHISHTRWLLCRWERGMDPVKE